ncbi:AAA family ATPase [Hornefia butyriciproducens]|uniref:cytidylate kinase-like family protein n=1 Tax=Hornefia butyriciproducens TaxID=2652293 RepID=UPI003F8C9AF0
MKKLVTVSREYGSGGRQISAMIAEKLGVPCYDKEIIDIAVKKSGLSREVIESAELRAKSAFTYTLSSAMVFGDNIYREPISMNEKLFLTQFDIIEQIGELGEGVIVGRCADYILKNIPNVTNVFIYAELQDRVKRCVEVYGDDPEEVRKKIATYDKARANYYNYHTCQKWGAYENYNLSINSSYISEEAAADLVVDFVKTRTYR